MIDKSALLRMSQAERRELASLLAELDDPVPAKPEPKPALTPAPTKPKPTPALTKPEPAPAPAKPDPVGAGPYQLDPSLRRERRLALIVSAGCCVFLAAWIVVLAATLPHHFDAHHWRAVWVNFDVFLLAAFAATAWAIWRERQVLILLLMLTGTMLCCDAWFDVGTSLATSGLWISLASAVGAELPLALLAFAGARQLLRATVTAGLLAGAASATAGAATEADCSLRRTPLAGSGLDEALPRRMTV